MQEIAVRGDHITLGQLLKLVGALGTGGDAKHYLSEHTPIVNGEPDNRRGRKLRPGDRVAVPEVGDVLLTSES